jgi:type III secretion protein R
MVCWQRIRSILLYSGGLALMGWCDFANAQSPMGNVGDEGVADRPILLLVALAGIGLVPLVLIVVTSFVKIAVVFAIVRQAIGTSQIPPTLVILGLTMMMTIFIMSPVFFEIYHDGQDLLARRGQQSFSLKKMDAQLATEMTSIAQRPFRLFMVKHAHQSETSFFLRIGNRLRAGRGRQQFLEDDFAVIVPAFMMSELKEAFQVGLILFMPFLVIDMVIANILMALGMQMLSPTVISLPFKMLLLVTVDGWHLIAKGLVLGYL